MKRIIITESQYRHILNNRHLLTEAETETFSFTSEFPDNIAFPVKDGVSFDTFGEVPLTSLNPKLQTFITSLKNAMANNKIPIDSVTIQSGASPKGATLDVPKGTSFTQDIVKKSYYDSGKVNVNNKVIAKNRGEALKTILTREIKQLEGKIKVNPSLTEKKVTLTIPAGILANPETEKDYKPKNTPFSKDKIIKVNVCNANIEATGSYGTANNNYLADMIVLDMKPDFTTNMVLTYNTYLLPDKFAVYRRPSGSGDYTELVIDTKGYVSTSTLNEKDKIGYQNQLSGYIKGAKLIQGKSNSTLSFTKEANYDYAIKIYAPFGGTQWSAKLTCSEQKQQAGFNWDQDWKKSEKLVFDKKGNPKNINDGIRYGDIVVVGEIDKTGKKGKIKGYSGYLNVGLVNGYALRCEQGTKSCSSYVQIRHIDGSQSGARPMNADKIKTNFGINNVA